MVEKTYNGWTNYATWRVNLEIFDGLDARDMGWHRMDKYDLAVVLMEYAEEIVSMDCKDGLALSYALSFMSEVNYREIADMMLSEYADESEDETETEDA
jgi:hypothetical protein